MSFTFGNTGAPATVLGAKWLMWVQAALLFMVAVMWLMAALLLGRSSSLSMGPFNTDGPGALPVGILYFGVALGFAYLGAAVGRRSSRGRIAAIAAEVVFAGVMSVGRPLGDDVLTLVIAVAVVVLLFAGPSAAAFGSGTPAARSTPSALPDTQPEPVADAEKSVAEETTPDAAMADGDGAAPSED